MRTPAILGLALALLLLPPRTAEACDPHCATFERLVGTVIVSVPTALLTSFIAPAVGKGMSDRADEPSYGAGLGYSLLGSLAGAALAVGTHAVLFPDDSYPDGSPMSLPVAVAFFSLPPAVGGGVASYLTYQDDSPQGPSMSVMITPSSNGLSLAVGGRF